MGAFGSSIGLPSGFSGFQGNDFLTLMPANQQGYEQGAPMILRPDPSRQQIHLLD